MKHKALLIDGHNFLFRGFYGVPTQAKRTDGTPINAVYGFFSLLRIVSRVIDPEYLIVMFDSETSIDKKKLIRPEYKANRTQQNDSVYCQLPLIKRCLDFLKIRWIENKHIEADDLIGTYSKKLNNQEICAYIGSNDYDFMQLVCNHTLVLRGYHGNVVIYKESEVMNKFGILPSQYVDYIALTGDSSDNIKGIKGIGKKRAVDLLSKHENIKGIYQSFDLLPQQLKRMLHGNEDFLIKQKEFLEIKRNLTLPNKFKVKDYSFSKKKLPEKMGKFLDRNWEKLT
jgi:DNA polymerase-1